MQYCLYIILYYYNNNKLRTSDNTFLILQESKFKETGVVTPNEFVIAGDHLVHTCPTWEWACGDECKTKSYLPKNKQYLITKNVPCLRRCKQVNTLYYTPYYIRYYNIINYTIF